MTNDKGQIKEYADGWISERKGTDVPAFLKVAYLVIALGSLVYMVLMRRGELTHATRGPLVRQFNMTSQSADGLIYAVIVLSLIGLAWLVTFAFRKPSEH
jgi:hypothetical protein